MRSALVLSILALGPGAQEAASVRLHGRFVDPAGDPVSGVELTLTGSPGGGLWSLRNRPTEGWTEPAPVASGADGTFELFFAPPRAFHFELRAEHPGFGRVGWTWDELYGGAVEDLGTEVLRPPGLLTGYVVDSSGGLLVDGWQVFARPRVTEAHRRVPWSFDAIDPERGTFRIRDLPPGGIELFARSLRGERIDVAEVVTESGRETEVELRYTGPDLRRRITVRPGNVRFGAPVLQVGSIVAIDAAGTRTPFEVVPPGPFDWQVLDLDPGAYSIAIEDARFLPWRREGVAPGQHVDAELTGSSAVEVAFVGVEPPKAWGIRARHLTGRRARAFATVREDGAAPPVDGRITGLVAGDVELEVRAAGFPPHYVEVPGLEPGEVRAIEVELRPAVSLRGRVVHADGSPAADVGIQLTRGEVPGHEGPPDVAMSTYRYVDGELERVQLLRFDAEATTDAGGAFRFDQLAGGPCALRVLASPWLRIDRLAEVPAGGDREVEIALPPMGAASITVLFPEELPELDRRLFLHPQARDLRSVPLGPAVDGIPVDADGRCLVEGLPVGEVRVVLGADRFDAAGREVEIGSLRVEAGATASATLDLRETYPVRGRIEARAGSTPVSWLTYALEDLDDPGGEPLSGRIRDTAAFLRPGRYRVKIDHTHGGWTWTAPEPLVVSAASPFRLRLDVPLIERAVRLFRADGSTAAGLRVEWESVDRLGRRPVDSTDEAGELVLTLPPGDYEMTSGVLETTFTWSAGEGPLLLILDEGR